MTRHVCGTCRFFRPTDAAVGRSGWCGHPLKQTTTDVRVLVRAGELNCRNDWDHDLWQLREDGDRVLDVTMQRPADPADRPSATPGGTPRRTLGEDRVEAVVASSPSEDVVLSPVDDQPRLVSEDLNRELLRRAHDHARARKLQPRPNGPPPRVADSAHQGVHRQEPIIISNDVQRLPIGEPLPRDLTRISRAPGEPSLTMPEQTTSAFSTIPEIESTIELPRREAEASRLVAKVDDFEMESIRTLETSEERPVQGRSADVRLGAADRNGARRGAEVDREWPTPQSRTPTRSEPTRRLTVDEPLSEPFQDEQGDDGSAHNREVLTEAEPRRQPDHDVLRPWGYVEPRRPRSVDVELRDLARPAPVSASRLWDDIPRCCRTCRDFRPADSGGRGWCTSRWAFRHRRMVDVDDLPCETTIGAWWLPSDDAWQDDQDVARHLEATPLMDRWIGRGPSVADEEYAEVASRARRRR